MSARGLGKTLQDIELGEDLGVGKQLSCGIRHLASQLDEERLFERSKLVLRGDDFFLECLQLLGDEPFAIRDRLFSDVIRGNLAEVRLRDFESVTKDLAVLDLQRGDTGARLFARFDSRDGGLGVPGKSPVFPDFRRYTNPGRFRRP